jgi:hypothetical protein
MLLKWGSSSVTIFNKFGDIQNMKIENLKHPFTLWAIVANFGKKFLLNFDSFLKKQNHPSSAQTQGYFGESIL